jgi:hypothetical protein
VSKTYITAAVAIVGALGAAAAGQIDWAQAAHMTLDALLVAFARHTVVKQGVK